MHSWWYHQEMLQWMANVDWWQTRCLLIVGCSGSVHKVCKNVSCLLFMFISLICLSAKDVVSFSTANILDQRLWQNCYISVTNCLHAKSSYSVLYLLGIYTRVLSEFETSLLILLPWPFHGHLYVIGLTYIQQITITELKGVCLLQWFSGLGNVSMEDFGT